MYEKPFYNYVYRLVHDRSLAEDLTQEVFLRVFQGLPKFSLRCRFTTWLFQVTKNRVLDELRANERRPRGLVPIDDIAPLEALDAPPERIEAMDAVWRAVDQLNPDLRMALLLRDVVGLPYIEIAGSLEVTLATVKWRIHKARDRCSSQWHVRASPTAEAGRRTSPRSSSCRRPAAAPASSGPARGPRARARDGRRATLGALPCGSPPASPQFRRERA